MNTKFAEIINEIPKIKGLNDADFEQLDAMMARAMTAFETSQSRKEVEDELQRLREQIKQIQASKNPAGAPSSPVGNAPPTEELFKTPFTSKKAEASSPEALNTPTPQKDTPLRDVDRDTPELIILSGDVSKANEALEKIQTIMEKIEEKNKASVDKLGPFNRETRDQMDALMREITRDDDYKYDTFRNALVSNRFNGRGLNNAYALKYTIMKYMKELLERKMPRKTVMPPRFQTTP